MVLLELGGNVDGDVAALFEGQVLCFVEQTEAIDHGFELVSKVGFVDVLVGSQVALGGAVLDQNWVCGAHWFTLGLKTGVGMATLNHPLVVIAIHRVHAHFLETRHWGVERASLSVRRQTESLVESIRARLESYLLTVADHIIGAEGVSLFDLLDDKDRASDGAWIGGCCGHHVALEEAWLLVVQVKHKMSLGLLVLEHHAVAVTEKAVCREGPRNAFVAVLLEVYGLAETSGCLLGCVIIFSTMSVSRLLT